MDLEMDLEMDVWLALFLWSIAERSVTWLVFLFASVMESGCSHAETSSSCRREYPSQWKKEEEDVRWGMPPTRVAGKISQRTVSELPAPITHTPLPPLPTSLYCTRKGLPTVPGSAAGLSLRMTGITAVHTTPRRQSALPRLDMVTHA